ncbi:uncharacterized protein ARMOST_06800 [Armillaria ostoyae]|uniref:Uncharacterized protein n=1 Tax=Armillaria ostoyae TaxID=47428 RepID=A0A284R441_ARMOS|nr:uncharacterized protein ARMOST_06800 [Armillaria ostoyae]
MSRSVRTGLYSTILTLSVLQAGIALTGAIFHRDTNRRSWVTQTIFESFTTFFAVVTAMWMCTLLFNNAKPHSTHLFARFITHIYSLGLLTIIWLALALMLSPQLPHNCDYYALPPDTPEDKWCSFNATSMALACMICVFCGVTTYLVLRSSRRTASVHDNVAIHDAQDKRDRPRRAPLPKPAKIRVHLYSWILVVAFMQTGWGICVAMACDDFAQMAFGSIAAFVALFNWIWASVLLSYNYRPDSRHTLTSAKAHLVSYATLAVVWLVLSICLTEQLPQQCNFEIPSDGEASIWCMADSAAAGMGWILTILCAS